MFAVFEQLGLIQTWMILHLADEERVKSTLVVEVGPSS